MERPVAQGGLRILELDGTSGSGARTHIIFSLGFALQSLGYRLIRRILLGQRNTTIVPKEYDLCPKRIRPLGEVLAPPRR